MWGALMRNRNLLLSTAAVSLCLLLLHFVDEQGEVAPQPLAELVPAFKPGRALESTLHVPSSTTRSNPLSIKFPGSVCELPEFERNRKRLKFMLIVFAWRRLDSLRRLLRSVQNAEYCGDTVALRIVVDGGAAPSVLALVRSFRWLHGPLQTRLCDDEGVSLGIRGMWIQTTHTDADDYHIVPLEDDIEVSPLYYWWLQRAQRSFGDFNDAALMKQRRLAGISLYTPRLNEIKYPQVKWIPEENTRAVAFRLGVPCSWGALFIGSVWKEFLEFYALRVRPPFFNFSQEATQRGVGREREPLGDPHVRVPNSRSNVWPRSWKRFMIDFMYGRGMVMLYPNLPKQLSFSTTYMERGGHSGKDGKSEELQVTGLRKDVDPLKTVPLIRRQELRPVAQFFSNLPPYAELPVFNLQHEQRTSESLVQQGFAFTEHVRWWGHKLEADTLQRGLKAKYAKLADSWSGLESRGPPGGCVPEQLAALQADRRGGARAADDGASPFVKALGRRRRAAAEAPGAEKRYLVYQPPSGLGEWYMSLRNAAAIARVLDRTLVIPHLLWDGAVGNTVAYSSIFDIAPLLRLLPGAIEMDEFLQYGLEPSLLILLHVKDPRLVPSRLYFDAVAGWKNVSTTHMPAQMCESTDLLRLYGGCSERVLAFSHLYAAFEGFTGPAGLPDLANNHWFRVAVAAAIFSDLPAVQDKVARITQRLRSNTERYTCVHLTDLDTAVISSRAPLTRGFEASLETADDDVAIDIAQPAARSVPFPASASADASNTMRQPLTVCDSYEAEARHYAGRMWVKQVSGKGATCHVSELEIANSLARLPPRQTVFVLADGQRALPEDMAEAAAAALNAEFFTVGDVVALLGLSVRPTEWPAIEQAVCASADTLLLNAYSPLSAVIERRASDTAQRASRPLPRIMQWMRVNSDVCIPLFTRTARFDILPNRFGILGQFGPLRKLQLATTNVSALIGWDGKIVPNASLELEVYVSNASHALSLFEYTKENNMKGMQFTIPPPPDGWRVHVWHSLTVPILDSTYSFPMSTPWDSMDRLEIYYANPHPLQPRGDYVRIRNMFLRSTRSYHEYSADSEVLQRYRPCRELSLPVAIKLPAGGRGRGRGRRGRDGNPRGVASSDGEVETQPEPDLVATEEEPEAVARPWWKVVLAVVLGLFVSCMALAGLFFTVSVVASRLGPLRATAYARAGYMQVSQTGSAPAANS